MATSEVRRVAGGVGAGDVAGSPGYMAPEQIEGREIGPATDVFALGVILYEILCGEVPFEQRDLTFASRAFQKAPLPPSRLRPLRNVPAALDRAALACLAVEPGSRPASARWIAEEIDAFLEGERARAEREREADELASLGERAIALFEEKDAEARRLRERSEDALASISTWEPPDRKAAAWDLGDRARDLASEAARALAEAEARFIQALGRVSTHRRARRGLTALELRQFEAAEREGDSARAAKFLDLARAHDDGTFALELSDQGEITIDSGPRGLVAVAARYVERGRRLVLEEEIPLGRTPTFAHRVPSGSWLIRLVTDAGELRCPVLVRRAHRHAVRARVPSPREVPEGMVLVPGGPFLARRDARGERLTAESLSDFAIGRFPVTLRMYAEFLDDLDEAERVRRVPHFRSGETRPLLLREGSGRWRAAPHLVEGAARARVGRDRELEIPAFMLSWYDAVAYTRWLAAKTQRKYRLPTDLEWEKAARGADGRLFPMGPHLDASFAKRRESRPEPPQPEPVGAFEWDESPYGVRDLAGGVADLTETSPDGRPLDRNFVEAHPEEVLPVGEPFVVFRGGWEAMTTASRTPMRNSQPLSERAGYVGFRLALSLDEHGSSELVVEPMERPTGSGAP
jgi:serine/threonine-protein kinase